MLPLKNGPPVIPITAVKAPTTKKNIPTSITWPKTPFILINKYIPVLTNNPDNIADT